MFIVSTVFRLIVLVATDFAMLPALSIMLRNKRHFEAYIGIFQLCTKTIFNLSQAMQSSIFLSELQWHFISDVLSISYGLMLVIHLMQIPNEYLNQIARYVAFSLSWISKIKDQWDSAFWQGVLVLLFLVLLGAKYVHDPKLPKIDMIALQIGILSSIATFIVFILFETVGFDQTTRIGRVSKGITSGIVNIGSGVAIYHLWKCIPVRKFKDEDSLPLTSTFV